MMIPHTHRYIGGGVIVRYKGCDNGCDRHAQARLIRRMIERGCRFAGMGRTEWRDATPPQNPWFEQTAICMVVLMEDGPSMEGAA